MEYKFIIQGKLDGLNEYTSANRTNPIKGGKMKRNNEDMVIISIRQYLRGVRIEKPIIIHYRFYEPDKRRDKDNILSTAMKFVQDSLVKCSIIKNDGWNEIENFTHEYEVDKINPRIEVTLEEVGNC